MLAHDELFSKIRGLAALEGLEPAGALPLTALTDERFAAWLDQGFAGEMDYLHRYRYIRTSPADHFAPFLSVIAFLVPYSIEEPSPSPSVGNVARYALGDDYHDVIKKKLFRIIDAIKALDPDFEAKACVDTAPILEKVAAERMGLGWQGKHSNLLREDRGSWFFIAELLVNRLVDYREVAKNRCGTCVDCIDICPTKAIVAPYVVDSRLCISYLTIELRATIPRELRRMIGHRIFGCDDCQEVCPWNRFAKDLPLDEFRARPGLRTRSLVDWLAMDLEEWRRTFRKSAVKRTKYQGFRRNVAVALGNLADPETLPYIAEAFDHSEPLVRSHLVWAVRKIPSAAAHDLLRLWQEQEQDASVLQEFSGGVDLPLAAR